MADHIQIGDIAPRKRYVADGIQTLFTYPFPIFKAADLEVYLDDARQDAGFAVSGAGQDLGGEVTFEAAPVAGTAVTLRRRLTLARQSDFQESGAFRARVINDELDFLTAALQQVADDTRRALQLSATDPDAVLTLPDRAARSGAFLAFDADGAPLAAAGGAGGAPASAFIATLLDDADAAAARETLGLETVSQAEAEAGTAPVERAWTARRVAQAVAALAASAFTTGDAKITLKAAADAGWVMADDGTIGDAGSGATTRANADTEALYALLWANVADAWAPVTGGRGASAAADFAAGKPLALTRQLGRALGIAGTGSGLTARALGETLGEEAHAQTAAEMAAHEHLLFNNLTGNFSDPKVTPTTVPNVEGAVIAGDRSYQIAGRASGVATIGLSGTTGSGDPANVMQPTAFWNVMIKI